MQAHGDAVVVLLDALTYVVIAAVAWGIRAPERGPNALPPRALAESERGRFRTPVLPREGWAAVRANQLAWALLWALLPFIVALESMNAVEVFLVRDTLGGSAADFGFWQAATGAGALSGALAAGRARDRSTAGPRDPHRPDHDRRGARGNRAGAHADLGLVLGAVLGLANAVSNAGLFAVFVRGIAAEARGRALALLGGLARATSLLALVLGGLAGATLGPRLSFVVAGGAGLVVAAWRGIRQALRAERKLPTNLNRPDDGAEPALPTQSVGPRRS